MKVLVIGHSSYDISCPVEEYPVENTKYRLSENVMCGGGPAGNAAFLLGKWGIETYYAGVVGSDDFGSKIKKEFETAGVNTEYLETNYEKPTSISFIMINKKTGSRTLFNIAGDRANLKKYDFNMDPDIVLIDGHEYSASMAALNKYPNAITIIDAGRITPELKELCKYCKYIVCSKGFAETMTKIKIDFANPNTLVQVYTALKNNYPKSEVVVTLEDKGALYAVNNEIKIMPGLKVTPVDTTGAGDIFHGAFTFALAKGYDLEKCVRYANITAGLSVKKIGARLSIPSVAEVSNYYNEKFPSVGGQQNPAQQAPSREATPNVAAAPVQQPTSVQEPVQEVANAVQSEVVPVEPNPAQAPVSETTTIVEPTPAPEAMPAENKPAEQVQTQEVNQKTAMSYEQAMQSKKEEAKW